MVNITLSESLCAELPLPPDGFFIARAGEALCPRTGNRLGVLEHLPQLHAAAMDLTQLELAAKGLTKARELLKERRSPFLVINSREELWTHLQNHHRAKREWCHVIEKDGGHTRLNLEDIYCPTLLGPRMSRHVPTAIHAAGVTLDVAMGDPEAPHLYISGEAGAGKTTTLRKVFSEALARFESKQAGALPPVLVVLNNLEAGGFPTALIAALGVRLVPQAERKETSPLGEVEKNLEGLQSAARRHVVHSILAEMPVLLLLDGLDEVSHAALESIIRDLVSMTEACPRCRVIVTGRSGLLLPELPRFRSYQILPFSPEQVEYYSRKRLGPDLSARFLSELALEDYRGIASRPLMLEFLCQLYGEFRALPRTQRECLQEVTQLYLTRWDRQRRVNRSWDERWRNLDRARFLMHLAHVGTQQDEFGTELLLRAMREASADSPLRLEDLPDFEAYLQNATGLVSSVSPGRMRFSFPVLRDHFLAEYIKDSGEPPSAQVLAENPDVAAMAVCWSTEAGRMFARVIAGPVRRTSDGRELPAFLRGLIRHKIRPKDDAYFGLGLIQLEGLLFGPEAVMLPAVQQECLESAAHLRRLPSASASLEAAWRFFRVAASDSTTVRLELRDADAERVASGFVAAAGPIRVGATFFALAGGREAIGIVSSTERSGDATGT